MRYRILRLYVCLKQPGVLTTHIDINLINIDFFLSEIEPILQQMVFPPVASVAFLASTGVFSISQRFLVRNAG